MNHRALVLLGDIEEGSQYINYAQGQLDYLIKRNPNRRELLNLWPSPNVKIQILTKPNRITINAEGGLFITFVDPASVASTTPDPLTSPYQPCIDRYLFSRYNNFKMHLGAIREIYSGGSGTVEYNAAWLYGSDRIPLIPVAEADKLILVGGGIARLTLNNDTQWYNKTNAISWSGTTLFVGGKYGEVTLDTDSDEQIVACCLVDNQIGRDASGGIAYYTAMLVTSRISSYSVPIESTRGYRNDIRIKTAVFDGVIGEIYNINLYNERIIKNPPSVHTEFPGSLNHNINTPVLQVSNFTQNSKQIAVWYTLNNNPSPNELVIEIMTFSDDYTSETTRQVFSETFTYTGGFYKIMDVRPDGNIFASVILSHTEFYEYHGGVPYIYGSFNLTSMSLWDFPSTDDENYQAMLNISVINAPLYGQKYIDSDVYSTARVSGLQLIIGYYSVRFQVYFYTVHAMTVEMSIPAVLNQDYNIVLRKNLINNALYTNSWSGESGVAYFYPQLPEYIRDGGGAIIGLFTYALSNPISIKNISLWGIFNIVPLNTDHGVSEYHPGNFNLMNTDKMLIVCGEFTSAVDPLFSYTLQVKLDIDPSKQDHTLVSGRLDELILESPISGMSESYTSAPPYGSHIPTPPYSQSVTTSPTAYTVTKVYMPMSVTHL